MATQRFNYIDGLRGIAILGVILTHAESITSLKGIGKYLLQIGGMGVQLFFVISAFTIFYSLSKTDGTEHQYRNFYIRRLFRIVPIYWIGIILYTSVYGLNSRGWLNGPELWHFPFHIFLINTFHPLTSSSVVPGGWSISVEVMFYLLVPLLYKYFYTNKRLAILMIISLLILPVMNFYFRKFLLDHTLLQMDRVTIELFTYRWIPSQLACFGFGVILFKIYRDGSYKDYVSNKITNFLLIVIMTVLLMVIRAVHISLPQPHHIYAFCFMVIALLLSVHPWKLYVNTFTIFMGKISYSGYLIHFLILKQITLWIETHAPSVTRDPLIYFLTVSIIGLAITIPLAYLSYKYIELNAVSLGGILIEKLNLRRGQQLSK